MDESENLDARLHALLDKRGQDLVRSLIGEFSSLNREIAALRREITALAGYQASRDRWLAIEAEQGRIAVLPRVVTIEPDQMLRFQDGFYPAEYTSDGIPFRWTGPSPQFTFDIFIDRSRPVEVRLDVLNCIDFEVQKNLSLLVDGESVPVTLKEDAPGFVATSILPPREIKGGTNLVFLTPATMIPPGTDETRSLGIAFSKFTAASGIAESAAAGERAAAEPPADETLAVAQA